MPERPEIESFVILAEEPRFGRTGRASPPGRRRSSGVVYQR
ncbi:MULTISPECIES: hypothetical protein [unclassified Streptosporangium]|nr:MULTISPECIES: hypothetical protein [unclassified Streptosporangium]